MDRERSSRKKKGTEGTSNFFGERLRLARIAHGYTQTSLAEAVLARQADISRLEAGRATAPPPLLLRAICEVLDVDASFFERPVVQEYARHECSFRHLQSSSVKVLEEVLARGTLHHEVITHLGQFVELPPVNIPQLSISNVEDIEAAAEATRERWGLGLVAPIVNMIRVAEHAGAVVTRLSGTSDKVDAFSRFGDPPVIVLASTKSSTSRDRFNVAHELGHLVMHRGQVTGDMRTEREAHRFAAALLLPRSAFAAEFRSLPVIDWPHLFEMKRRWGAAGSAILHRADELGLVSAVATRRLYRQHSWRGWNKGEPYEPAEEKPELISLSIEVARRDFGADVVAISAALGWRARTAENVAGFAIPANDLPANVVMKPERFRRKK